MRCELFLVAFRVSCHGSATNLCVSGPHYRHRITTTCWRCHRHAGRWLPTRPVVHPASRACGVPLHTSLRLQCQAWLHSHVCDTAARFLWNVRLGALLLSRSCGSRRRIWCWMSQRACISASVGTPRLHCCGSPALLFHASKRMLFQLPH